MISKRTVIVVLLLASCHKSPPAKPVASDAGRLVPRLVVARGAAGLTAAEKSTTPPVLPQTAEVWVRVILPEMSMRQRIIFTVLTPDHESWRRVEGSFDPTNAQIPGGYALDDAIELVAEEGGPLPPPGDWTVKAEVDGLASPLTASFTIR